MNNSKQIDFIPPKKSSDFTFKKIAPPAFVFIILLGIVFTTRAVISSNDIAQQFGSTTILEQIKHLVSSEDKRLSGEEAGRINILILGIGGGEHDGGQLTDTIIAASIDPKQNKMGMLSIPRDLVVPIENVGWQKINAAHAYGVAMDKYKRGRSGAALAQQTVEKITSLDMDYYFKIDFKGFKKIVDALGGIRVEVPTSFDDYEYPDDNFGYQEVHFDQGWQNLNGDRALKYVRSRHGTSGQDNDFARAVRQQQVLRALQARVLAISTLLNPNKLLSIAEIIGNHIETNMEIWEIVRLYDIGRGIDIQNINQLFLSTGENGLLVVDKDENESYLLRPRAGNGDFSEIKKAAQNIIAQNPLVINDFARSASSVRIAVQNGTAHEGLASITAEKLKRMSYSIADVSNAKKQDYEKTVIYKLSENVLSGDVQTIRDALNANIAPNLPEFITLPDADVLIIVGEDNI